VHVYAWPIRYLHLDGLGGKVAYAQLLNDGSEVRMVAPRANRHEELPEDVLTLELPIQKPDVTVPVVELFVK